LGRHTRAQLALGLVGSRLTAPRLGEHGAPATHTSASALPLRRALDLTEAARALGLTTNHVAVLLHRARKELERCMQAA